MGAAAFQNWHVSTNTLAHRQCVSKRKMVVRLCFIFGSCDDDRRCEMRENSQYGNILSVESLVSRARYSPLCGFH
jgi:hypothetical protein